MIFAYSQQLAKKLEKSCKKYVPTLLTSELNKMPVNNFLNKNKKI